MLKGKTVCLYPIAREDLDQTRAWANDMSLNSDILRVLPVMEPDQERWFNALAEDRSRIVFAAKTPDSGLHVGNTGFYHIDWLHRRAEFWILIGNTAYWGKGMGSEVTKMMLDYGFDHLNLNRIFLHVSKKNERAVRMYEELGFSTEGICRQHYFIDGSYIDLVIMSMLEREYHAAK